MNLHESLFHSASLLILQGSAQSFLPHVNNLPRVGSLDTDRVEKHIDLQYPIETHRWGMLCIWDGMGPPGFCLAFETFYTCAPQKTFDRTQREARLRRRVHLMPCNAMPCDEKALDFVSKPFRHKVALPTSYCWSFHTPGGNGVPVATSALPLIRS